MERKASSQRGARLPPTESNTHFLKQGKPVLNSPLASYLHSDTHRQDTGRQGAGRQAGRRQAGRVQAGRVQEGRQVAGRQAGRRQAGRVQVGRQGVGRQGGERSLPGIEGFPNIRGYPVAAVTPQRVSLYSRDGFKEVVCSYMQSCLAGSSQPEENVGRAHYKLCDRLKLEKKQRRMCRRDPGVAETLMEAISMSFKETAFLYAISSAGLTHAMAKACSAGRMERCTCDEAPDLENRKAWQWGGCGDNLKYSNKFVKDFLGKRSNKDLRARVDMHNTNVGMKVIKAGVETTCKCHGVSGSCTVQTCWRQLSPFHEIGKQLKQRYETSLKVGSSTNEATGEGEISQARPQQQQPPPGPNNDPIPRTMDLLHIEDSPSFCRPSKYSPGTSARKCYKDKNCDAICCGRGHNTQSRVVTRPCQCQVRWCCYVECKQCTQREEVYTCKG
ncbi:unnamed protein product [Coregonus sp. 'balchen']|nr:unnamed protein product [Coregonus sp. 'balchen']